MAKKSYELKADVGHAVTTLTDGKQLVLSADGNSSYETSDPLEQALLDDWDAVKAAERKKS